MVKFTLILEILNFINLLAVDAEELRDVNISKKELSELVAELYDGLMTEGLFMESIDLESPRKFLLSFQDDKINTPNNSADKLECNVDASQQLDFDEEKNIPQLIQEAPTKSISLNTTNVETPKITETQTECSQITSTNGKNDYIFQPNVISTPSIKHNNNYSEYTNFSTDNMTLIPIAQPNGNMENSHNRTITIASSGLSTQIELIAVPIAGQPNHFQLAKIVDKPENESNFTSQTNGNSDISKTDSSTNNINHNNSYISVKRHIIAEYIDKFKDLQHAQDNKISSTTTESTITTLQNSNTGFTQYQYDLMQQQLRIHVQQLTQTFIQTYCHPELWKLAPKSKELLLDLQEKAKENVNFQAWNLQLAIELIHNWQKELDQDTPENTELMNFLHRVTNNQGRQIPRFHPRILECYLNSPAFMYPQYLPKIPFSAKSSVPIFSPVEAYLIAMGLEKHLQIIYERKEKITKTTPLRMACKRLAKDTVCGKRYRRIWDHIMHLQKVDYYNPIKYFFEHNTAPPVEHDPIWTFNNNVVLPPKDRIPELPLVFQTYLQKKNEPPKEQPKKKVRKKCSVEASESFKNSYIEFVQEIVGQDIPTPNLFYDPDESSDTPSLAADSCNAFQKKLRKSGKPHSSAKRKLPQSLTINVNYIYGNGLETPNINFSPNDISRNVGDINVIPDKVSQNLVNTTLPPENIVADFNASDGSAPDSTINNTTDLPHDNLCNITTNSDCPIVTYSFDWKKKTLQPVFDLTQAESNICPCSPTHIANDDFIPVGITEKKKKIRKFGKVHRTFKLHKNIKRRAFAYREKRYIRRRCEELITTYSSYLENILQKYNNYPLVQYYYRYFKALELYTYLLKELKSMCNKNSNMSGSNSSPNLKRTRNNNLNPEDDNPSTTRQVRKLHRQEENFRHMLLPDTPQETNRKDAIYAFNFYEKVEDAFKAANKPEDCKKFNTILKSFDPKKDKVSDLYYKLEKLFLPDHPELAQVFLTFLLPSEAAEIGKFFEHFMISNMNTFINKLNIYFNKQPAQIRKVYNCLNDLAEDPDVTMKKVETKVVPLLKGNQFLIDWFMQQFPQNTPPERLFSKPEHINLKDQQCNRSGEYVENLTDLMDSPTNDPQQQLNCQLRYINGRIFYGSKMLLPAKLSFMANSYKEKIQTEEHSPSTAANVCVHGIREHGEKRLQAAVEITSTHTNVNDLHSADDQEKSEEEDMSKGLVIDTTADEEDSCSSVELCDEASLRAHAMRLNPSVYSSTCYSANATSTPNIMNNFQGHHFNAKKTSLNFNEEAKFSPRKTSISSSSTHQNSPSPLAVSNSNFANNSKEKRKSPSKKTKSPSNSSSKNLKTSTTAVLPMVVIHEANSAIQCAKRLKSLIEEGQQNENAEEVIDSKDILKIVAKPKNSLRAPEGLASSQVCQGVKEENMEDLDFPPEQLALSPSPFPCLRMEIDSNEEDVYNSKTPIQTTSPDSDEDCKIEIVSSLSTSAEEITSIAPSNDTSKKVSPLTAAWTRDEDKVILIEMKLGSQNRKELYHRIAEKLPNRTMLEITSRHQFLIDFLSKLQGK